MVNEELNRDEKAIADILGGLPRVTAPNDFDFRVKARITQGVPASSRWSWVVATSRFSVPLVLLLLVGGYVGFTFLDTSAVDLRSANEIRPSGAFQIPETVSTPEPFQQTKELRADNDPIKPKEIDPKVTTVASNAAVPAPLGVNNGGGSLERGLGTSRPIYPRGVDPNAKTPVVPKEFTQPGKVTAKDVMNLLGLDVVYSESGWKVESVKENSTAQRAGLKSGDVVEAINEQPMNEKTSFNGRFTSKSMRLKRDGMSVDIDLQKP